MATRKQVIFPKYNKVLEQMGENIKIARKRRKLTMIQIAERAESENATVNSNGKRHRAQDPPARERPAVSRKVPMLFTYPAFTIHHPSSFKYVFITFLIPVFLIFK